MIDHKITIKIFTNNDTYIAHTHSFSEVVAVGESEKIATENLIWAIKKYLDEHASDDKDIKDLIEFKIDPETVNTTPYTYKHFTISRPITITPRQGD